MAKTIVVTSDVHLGITSPEKVKSLVMDMGKQSPDAVVLAGDIGEPVQNFGECLEVFSKLKVPTGIVIGNHDLYNLNGESSEELWTRVLPGLVREWGFVWMEEESMRLGDVAIVGSLAWYDYSSRAPEFEGFSDDFFYENKGNYVKDGVAIDWERKDKEFSEKLREGFLKRLEEAQEDPAIKRIIIVTHVPLFREQLVQYYTDTRASDAYFGNLTTGKVVMKFSKVTDVVSGHTHRGVDKKTGGIRVQVVASRYKDPKFIALEV